VAICSFLPVAGCISSSAGAGQGTGSEGMCQSAKVGQARVQYQTWYALSTLRDFFLFAIFFYSFFFIFFTSPLSFFKALLETLFENASLIS